MPDQEAPRGFPRLAAFVSSDEDYEIYRGFRTLHNRVIHHREVELTELEKRLTELDKSDEHNPATSHRLRRIKHQEGWDGEKNKLIDDIELKLKNYGMLHSPLGQASGLTLENSQACSASCPHASLRSNHSKNP